MKTPPNFKNILAFILLIIVTSACKEINTDKRSCIYCGKAIPDNKEIAIKLNENEHNGANPPSWAKKVVEKKKMDKFVGRFNSELCSMKCYFNFKNTFYPHNRDSISGSGKSVNVWILNEKRKSIEDY
jgi:hypothetical protein